MLTCHTRQFRLRALVLAAGVFLSSTLLFAQGGGWTSIGPRPAGIAALITAADKSVIYIGSSGGGVRKSNDNGRTWSSVNRGLPSLSVSSLAMDAAGPETLYV